MGNTTNNDELARKIERLVQEHIAEIRRTAQLLSSSVARGFARRLRDGGGGRVRAGWAMGIAA